MSPTPEEVRYYRSLHTTYPLFSVSDSLLITLAKNLERRAEDLEELCGQILATIVVNRDRGTLQPEEQYRADWNKLLEGWSDKLSKLRTPPQKEST